MRTLSVDVFVVGAGPTGLAAAALLAKQAVGVLAITRYPRLAASPRAHITNQRAMEIFRDLGIEERVKRVASPNHLMGKTIWATSFADSELARCWAWGDGPLRQSDYRSASPSEMCNIHQHILEPILHEAATEFGASVLFNTELVSMRQDADGVYSLCKDRVTGEDLEIKSKYAIGADGDKSTVCRELGFEVEGHLGLGHMVDFWLEVDLSKYTAYRPAALYMMLQPGGHFWSGSGTFVCVRPWNEWSLSVPYDPADGEPDVSETAVIARARRLIGDPDIQVKFKSSAKWTISQIVAKSLRKDRVLIAGNAAHRHPPANGLGSNTCIQDAFNLSWKLALVLGGRADPSLLDSYEAERLPVGRQVVDRAMRSVGDLRTLSQAIGLNPGQTVQEGWRGIHELFADSAEGRRRRAHLEEVMRLLEYNFNAHGVEMGQRYASSAIVSDGADLRLTRDPELYYEKSTVPGSCLPHAWVEINREAKSTLDLVGHGQFTVLTGIGGGEWIAAAKRLAKLRKLPIATAAIGAGLDAQDVYGEWAQVREIAEDGCLLVRPDRHIALRAMSLPENPFDVLAGAFVQMLGHGAPLARSD